MDRLGPWSTRPTRCWTHCSGHRAEAPTLMLAVAVLLRLMPSANALLMGSPGFAIWGGAWRRCEAKILHPPQPEPHKKTGLDVSSESQNKSKNRTIIRLLRQSNRSLLPLNGSQRRPSIVASHRAERFERRLGQDKKFRSGSVPRGLASHWGRL